MKLIITGGSGFIGTNLMEYYLSRQNDFEVINIDLFEPKIEGHKPFWKKLDIRNETELNKVFKDFNPSHVVHLAARTDLSGTTIKDYDSNTIGVSNLLQACEECQNIQKVLFTSSMLVCKLGYQPKHECDYNPSTIYGESKVFTETLVRNASLSYEWAILRPTSIWGPWFGEPYRNFFDLLIEKKYFHIGDRSCTKTYGFVDNVVYQINTILFAEKDDIDKKLFYLGDYNPYSLEDWANEVGDALGNKVHKLPFSVLTFLAKTGDFLKGFGISFPMTSFRLKNMTTDNIIDMKSTQKVAPNLPVSRKEGIAKTLDWISTN
ncbi:NAD-dependent epimerase/dehydratase family protein [Algoriphagus yeomjeoni]|uniref:Nucleoside-diphosphate-sugar epimerase n=1 Tax=Algoriphagus yeomjeoni TaxID=291403 RepID=A0A327PPR4_9BACT|nr:NAD(P)-dependent oxidoreductase [Algoriphagus yeomjeoni]RAI91656.1 nucleoside-diphosphate-sugar epimerase [Algoriphagus yeomjeoni]